MSDNHDNVPIGVVSQRTGPTTYEDPEEGISSDVKMKLRDRRVKGQVLKWDILWRVLFPMDYQVPSGGTFSRDHGVHHSAKIHRI